MTVGSFIYVSNLPFVSTMITGEIIEKIAVGTRLLWNPAICRRPVIVKSCNTLVPGYCRMLQYVGFPLLWNAAIRRRPVIVECCNMLVPGYCGMMQYVGARLL